MASNTSKRKSDRPQQDRVWIELEVPNDEAHAQAICAKANRMLQRLMPGTSMAFWRGQNGYCITVDSAGSYYDLPDRGEWFNLDYLGREGA